MRDIKVLRAEDNKQLKGSRPWLSLLKNTILIGTLLTLTGCAVHPQPLAELDICEQARQDMAKRYKNQEPLGKRLGLYEAMARAVKYNLDHRVKLVEKALAKGHLVQAQYDLLPQLVASAGYSHRNNESGSSSKSLISGNESLEWSTSQEQSQFSSQVAYVWNVLDFGVGYVKAQQMADQVQIAEEWRRKAVQNIIQDVRRAYWRAAVAEALLPEMDTLLARVESALQRSQQMEKLMLQEPLKTLAYQQELLETVKQLWRMRKELAMANTELATLINLKPGSHLRIGLLELPTPTDIAKRLNIEALEEQALLHRPELRTEAYRKRIDRLEVRKAMLRMLPGLEINFGTNYNNNSYLYNNSWMQVGSQLTWNAFNLLSGPAAIKSAKIQQNLAEHRYLATAMMALTQVHLAHQRYSIALKEYRIADNLAGVHKRRLHHTASARQANAGSELEEIRNQAGALSARMYRDLAYTELQIAVGRILQTGGIDPLPPVEGDLAVAALGQVMKQHEEQFLTAWWTQEAAVTSTGLRVYRWVGRNK